MSAGKAEQKAYCRFLKHPKVTEEAMIEESADRLSGLVESRDLLCLQDTSEVNLIKHWGRIKDREGLGRLDYSGFALGFKIHPVFVLDAAALTPLGFSAIKLWHRPEEMPDRHERQYQKKAIVDKESYKWIEAANKSKDVLSRARRVTFIQDREADIYELFCQVPDERTHLVVRSSTDRRTAGGIRLSELLALRPRAGTHTIFLETDKRKKRTKQSVELEVRYCDATLRKPNSCRTGNMPADKQLWVVEARQVNPSKRQSPVHWRLLTTHPIDSFESALQIIEWYSCRWYIEQVFRLLKNKGFQIEQTELESGMAIRKLTVMMLTAILKIIQMRLAYDDENEGQPITEVYSHEEVSALHLVNRRLQGKTEKLQNHHSPARTKWATWIIARLGGWSGYASQGPPGIITLRTGLERFSYILEGMLIAKDMGTR